MSNISYQENTGRNTFSQPLQRHINDGVHKTLYFLALLQCLNYVLKVIHNQNVATFYTRLKLDSDIEHMSLVFTLVVDHQRGANFVQMNIYVINSVQYDENSIETRRIVTSVSSWFLAALAALYLTLVSDWLTATLEF